MKRVLVTGATGQIAYSLVFRIANGDFFPQEEKVALHLYDMPGSEIALAGLVMELEDCAFPLLQEIRFGTDIFSLSEGVDLAVLVGAKPRGPGMERKDLLKDNGAIFINQGRAINECAHKHVKVLVVGNPCNTNCLIAMHHAPSIPRNQFHALMRLDQNRAVAQIAKKAQKPVSSISRMTIWGNHSTTQVPDFTHVLINSCPLEQEIKEIKWLQEELCATVQNRGAEVIKARGKSSAGSAANAIVDAIRALYTPTPIGQWFTSAVCSDNNPYGIEEGLIFGFPCVSDGKENYEIVPDLQWDMFIREKIARTQEELISERACIQELLK